jgi:hypothetical protein
MEKKSPFILDRAIPLYPSMALFLDYIPGVDDRSSRDKNKPSSHRRRNPRTGELGAVRTTLQGVVRSLVLTQLDHRLNDNPGDYSLLKLGGTNWYARSFEKWHEWDFPCFPFPRIKKAFQDLIEAGYILARSQVDFPMEGLEIADRKALLRVMRVYTGKAFGIDYAKLETDMAADERVAAYFERFPGRTKPVAEPVTPDQDDPTDGSGRSDTPDRDDPTPRIETIRQSGSGRSDRADQDDPTERIEPIRDQQSPDQQSLDQSLSSAAAAEAAAPPDPDSRRADLPENLPPMDQVQQFSYMKLLSMNVDPAIASDYARNRSPIQIEAWIDYVVRANRPGSNIKPVSNPGGFLRSMLEHPDNLPREPKSTPAAGERFLSGHLADEIKH